MVIISLIFLLIIPYTTVSEIIPVVNNTIACGPNQPLVTTLAAGFVTSPNFDTFRYYPQNSSCSWTLIASTRKAIRVKVLDFALNYDCRKDHLEVYDGSHISSNLIGIFCGNWIYRVFFSTGNAIHLKFTSSVGTHQKGFRFYFEHEDPMITCNSMELSCRNHKKCVKSQYICDGRDDCGDGTDEEKCYNGDKEPSIECGEPVIPPIRGNDRIVGGRDALPHSWPWQASLKLPLLDPYGHQCGGSLINNQWVLTAAHCFKSERDPEKWLVVLGKYNKLIKDQTEQYRYIEDIHIHPNYRGFEPFKATIPWVTRKSNDIAVVKLNAPISLSTHVLPVCMPSPEFDVPIGTLCHVTGWGDTYGSGHDFVLKQAMMPIVSRAKCQQWYPYYGIGDTMLCAGYHKGGHDSCKGDSGGPLVFQNITRWYQVGLVSTGGICGEKQQPGIYTEVAPFVKWIRAVLLSH